MSAALCEIGLAETEIRDASGALSGPLCIAGSAYFVARFVVPAIREFSTQNPRVAFDLRISEAFTEHVRTGVDLMIRIGQLPASPLKTRKVASLRRVVVAAPSYRTPARVRRFVELLAGRLRKEIV